MLLFVYTCICIAFWRFSYQEMRVVITLTGLTPPNFVTVPSQEPVVPPPPLSFVQWDVVVCFVDISGIVDHHCLHFLFMLSAEQWSIWKISFHSLEYYWWKFFTLEISLVFVLEEINIALGYQRMFPCWYFLFIKINNALYRINENYSMIFYCFNW